MTTRLPPFYKRIYRDLARKRDWFSKRKRLASDGSFFYSDKKLADDMDCPTKTIMRARRRLEAAGYIKCQAGKWTGSATKYWILQEPTRMSASTNPTRLTNSPQQTDRMSIRACQSVTPTSKEQIDKTPHLVLPQSHFDQTYLIKNDIIDTTQYLLEQGYSQEQIDAGYETYKKSVNKETPQ